MMRKGLKMLRRGIILGIFVALAACTPKQPPLPLTNDPINCDTYRRHTIRLTAAAWMARHQPEALDAHNTNEANAAACALGDRSKSLGPR